MTFVPITGKCPVCHNDSANSAFQAGAASRDAEIAELKTVPMRYRRMAFNAQLQDEVARLEQERDQLRERVALLRDALKEAVEDYSDRFDMSSPSTNPGIKWIVKQGKEALTATEPKP